MTNVRVLFLSLVALASYTVVESSKSLHCPNECAPNGTCVNGECKCNEGYAGADCSFPFVQCPDDKTMCFDGAQCQRISMKDEENKREDGYICDCQHLSDASPFQIQECENPDSQACEVGQPTSAYAFCTNGGQCKEMIHNGSPHAGCICPDDFEGRHCQYRKGTAPETELEVAYVDKRSHLAGGVKFIIVAIVFALVGFALYHLYQERQQKVFDSQAHDPSKVDATLQDLEVTKSADEEDLALTDDNLDEAIPDDLPQMA